MNKKQKQGFSLIEIIVAVAILAIIIGIAVPTLNTLRQQSEQTAQGASAKTLNDAIVRAQIKNDLNIQTYLDNNDQEGLILYLDTNRYIEN